MKDIKYIQLEASGFLTDIDFQMMNAEQRGVYCSIIFYLYCNEGKLELGDNSITLLSGKFNKLAMISGCEKIGADWDTIWQKIAHKFKITGNILTHKRVTAELLKTQKYIKEKSEGGKKGMKSRWGDNSLITKVSKSKVSKEKVSKNKYKEYVLLTNEEYLKLSGKIGAEQLESLIDDLNNYIGSTGRKYKSHYHTLLNWAKSNYKKTAIKKKTKLFPISGKTCSRSNCPLPAVYKNTKGSYDRYDCSKHMPEKVKENFE